MKNLKRLHVLMLYILFVYIFYISDIMESGASFSFSQDDFYIFASSKFTDLVIVFMSLAFIFYCKQYSYAEHDGKANIMVKTATFLIDLAFIVAIFTPIFAMFILLAEYFHVSNFSWVVERQEYYEWDYVVLSTVLVAYTYVLYMYYYVNIINKKSTIGQFLFGYKVIIKNSTQVIHVYMLISIIKFIVLLSFWPIVMMLEIFTSKELFKNSTCFELKKLSEK